MLIKGTISTVNVKERRTLSSFVSSHEQFARGVYVYFGERVTDGAKLYNNSSPTDTKFSKWQFAKRKSGLSVPEEIIESGAEVSHH